MALAGLLLCLAQADSAADPSLDPAALLAARVAELVLREEAPTQDAAGALRAELATLGALHAPLFALLSDWQTPAQGDESGKRLNEAQRALVWTLVGAQAREGWKDMRASALQGEDPAVLRAALRLEGALAKSGAVRPLWDLARHAEELGRFDEVAEALEDALVHLCTREPRSIDALHSAWKELPVTAAASVVHALERSPSQATVDCLWDWLGRRDALEATVVLALGSLHAWVDVERHAQLLLDVQARLSGSGLAVTQAAATTLGRIGSPATVPWLLELLVHEDASVQRTALTALRQIGGVRLPGSSTAWRSWYAREETWFQEHAPALLDELVAAEESEDPVTKTRAVLRSMTEHRLHRDELAEHVEPLLAHERPRLRILACQAFERLASRRSLPWLVATLRDEDPGVVSAAHAALRTLEGVTLGTEPEPWCERLGLAVPALRP
jgi:HEAT repeat protein